MKIFLVCGVGNGAERNQAMLLFRQLSTWGNEVTLLDLSVLLEDSSESLSSYLCQMHMIHLLDLIEEAEATIITTNEREGPLSQIIQRLLKLTAKEGMLDGNRYVWNREGMNCIILGGSVKKNRVARQLWGILSNDTKLDLSDIFPAGEPKTYHIDYNRETAGPCAL
eukprot:gene12129-13382_t